MYGIYQKMKKSMKIKEYIIVAFLDIEGAFSNIQFRVKNLTIVSCLFKNLTIFELLGKLVEQMLKGNSIISTLGV